MSDSSKLEILKLLTKEWEINGPPGILDISDIVSMVPLAPSDTMQSIKELFSSGMIAMNELKTSVFLTPEGYDHITEFLK